MHFDGNSAIIIFLVFTIFIVWHYPNKINIKGIKVMWKFLGACFCVLLSLFFAADKTVLIENLNKPNTARIYIEGKRPQRNISVVSDTLFNQSSWCKDCVNTKTIFSNDTGHLKAKITAKDSDTVTISLMGQHFMLDNKKCHCSMIIKTLL